MNAVSEKPAADVARPVSTPTPPAAPPPRRSRRRLLQGTALIVVLIGGAVMANWWFTEGAFIESTDNAYVEGDIAVLGPRIEGDVGAIPVADNQFVKAGAPLIQLDPSNWLARLDQARGAAAEAAAAVVTSGHQIDQSRAALVQSDAMIAQAQAEVTRADAEARRNASLVASGVTSRQANEQAVADAAKAAAALAAAQAQKGTLQQALTVSQAQLVQAQAHQQAADAAVKLAENNMGDTVIRAPFDGIVGNRAAQLGQHVMPGQQLIAVAPPPQALYVIANFKETQLRAMQPGQKVELTADIDTATPVTGHVNSLAPATGALFSLLPPENATGNFTKVVQRIPVKITLDADDAAKAPWLRAGLSVTADVDTRAGNPVRLGIIGSALAALHLR